MEHIRILSKGVTLKTVSVVIPMRNEAEILERCLEAMENLNYPEDLLEIVIVNDGRRYTSELIRMGIIIQLSTLRHGVGVLGLV